MSIVFVKDLSIIFGSVDVMKKWNILIDYDSGRGPCPSIHHQTEFSVASTSSYVSSAMLPQRRFDGRFLQLQDALIETSMKSSPFLDLLKLLFSSSFYSHLIMTCFYNSCQILYWETVLPTLVQLQLDHMYLCF